MKAIIVNEPGNAKQLRLEECPTPPYKPNEILVQIKAAGINYIDVYIREGLYKAPQYPYIPGKEGSGIVVARGKEVTEFKEGDRIAFCSGGTGSYAEYTAIPADQAVLIPPSVSFETAAAAMLQGMTAYYLSHLTFPIQKNQDVLIHAGSGGVGLLLIQMAKMLGAKIFTTVSTSEKAEIAKGAGADEVILYTQESFREAVMRSTDDRGVAVVYDAVGKTTFDDSLKSLAIRGMLVSYGQSSGSVPPLDLSKLAEKSLFLTRPSLFHYIKTKAELHTLSSVLFDLITKQQLKMTIGKHYPLQDASQAHMALEARKTIGKLILIV